MTETILQRQRLHHKMLPNTASREFTRIMHPKKHRGQPQVIRRWYEVWAIDPVTVRMNPALVAKMLKENLQTGKPRTMKSLPISLTTTRLA